MGPIVERRQRVAVRDLPSYIPQVPVFDGEDKLDVPNEATAFLNRFKRAVEDENWEAFGELIVDEGYWKDSLTLTFDKRTIMGKQNIVKAWKSLMPTRKPSGFASDKDDLMTMDAQFVRMAPTFATLDVPFSFFTENPRTRAIGTAKLVPVGSRWKIWILSTAVMTLEDHPFEPLPRQSPSLIDPSQRGKSEAQGLPRIDGVLDAIVVGGNSSGLGNAIYLDAIGTNVAIFDQQPVAGGEWTMGRFDTVTLHHPTFMIQLPLYPVPNDDEYPKYLTGRALQKYYSSAVETLKLPYFAGIKVVSNKWDEEIQQWRVLVRDVKSGQEANLKTKNLVISTGFYIGAENPRFPDMADHHLFKGPVQHTSQYRNPEPYQDKDVVVVGSGNSAHDVAHSLVLGNAKSVTILQRSPTVLLDFDKIGPLFAARYKGDIPVDTADFLDSSLPTAVGRELVKGMVGMVINSQPERNAELESKGYLVKKDPDVVSLAYEERGRSFYMDQPKTFEMVFDDRIKVARGEARRFIDGGLVAHDLQQGTDKTIKADGVVFATGYENIDLPKRYAESGFLDEKSASMIENVNLLGVDNEGEIPGAATFSGHPHLYFSGIVLYMARWIGRYTAIQIKADIEGEFPARYPRSG